MKVKVDEWWPFIQGPYDDKWGYIWGTSGVKWTQARQDALVKKYNSDPDKYADLEKGAKYGKKWIGNMVIDCSGMPYRAFNQFNIKIAHGSNSIWKSYLSEKGKLTDKSAAFLATLPKGAAIFTGTDSKKPHIGTYDGNGYVIEAQGTIAGVVRTAITATKWKYWGLYKNLEYGAGSDTPDIPETKPTLRKGDKGPYVTLLQTQLLNRGYKLPKYGADGSFGNETLAAVKLFQKDWGLKEDGIVGEETWKFLESSPEKMKTYTVTIPNISREMAEDLLKKYSGTMVLDNE